MVSDPELIRQLDERTASRRTGRVNKKNYGVWGIPDLQLTRWKFAEWDYYSPEKAKMPITSRGLFTKDDKIIVRGYNKFFNIDEVATTKLNFLQSELSGPFYATVKENGYLALIAGYSGKLIVTSKNSSGADWAHDDGRNYSKNAREWVLKHLASVGKTEEEFANLLENNDWTAAGEVCDDGFEEHLLSYDSEMAGIYFNGLNRNTTQFVTEPPEIVQRIGDEFGFKRTDFLKFGDFTSLMDFLEKGQKTGKFGARDVEGFVLRAKCHGNDFFFKFKFEEPYLMYRSWRQTLIVFLEEGEQKARSKAMRSKHRTSCLRFLMFSKEYMKIHPELVGLIQTRGQGIIELRNAFLEATHNTVPGAVSDSAASQALLGLDITTTKYMLVTVATLGCGKSTVAEVLTKLMPTIFGHRQNDNMKSRKGLSKFAALQHAIIEDYMDGIEVVTLDRNNPSRQERSQIFDEFSLVGDEMGLDIKFICLNYLPDGPSMKSEELTRERVYARGDQHSTVKVSQLSQKGVSGIMKQFEDRFQIVNPRTGPDNQFDLVIDLKAGESVANVHMILKTLRKHYPKLPIPEFSDEDISSVFDEIHERPVEILQPIKKLKARDMKKLKYFGIHLGEQELVSLVNLAKEMIPADLTKNLIFKDEGHVTLAHKSSHPEKFSGMLTQYESQIKPSSNGKFEVAEEARDVTITELLWTPEMAAFRAEVTGSANPVAHVTIALKDGVPGKEANKLFAENENSEVSRKQIKPITFIKQMVFCSF